MTTPTEPSVPAPKPIAPAHQFERIIALALFLLLLIGSFLVMSPFLSALAWAFVMAYSLWPVWQRLLGRLKGRRTIGALIMSAGIAAVLVVPTLVIVLNLTDDARDLAVATRRWATDGAHPAPTWLRNLPWVGTRAADRWDATAIEVRQLFDRLQAPSDSIASSQPTTLPSEPDDSRVTLVKVLRYATQWITIASLAIFQGVVQILLSVFLTFFIFRDGEALGNRLVIAIRRIAGERGSQLVQLAGSTVRGVVYGILGTALVQGVMAGLGFAVAGVPGAALLGLITFFLSPLPVGPPLIWIPAAVWLFHQGSTGWGVFMIIWGIAVSSVDNVVKPLIISKGSAMPFILVLLGVIGGALVFGLIGVFLGPTLLAVTYRLIDVWSKETLPA